MIFAEFSMNQLVNSGSETHDLGFHLSSEQLIVMKFAVCKKA